MQKDFILPTSPSNIDLARWLIPLRPYGVDLLMLADNALNTLLTDGANHCDDIIRYVNDSVCQNFQMEPKGVGGETAEKIDNEIRRMCDYAVSGVDVLAAYMRPFVFAAEQEMCKQGVDPLKLVWTLSGSVGSDIVITVAEGELDGNSGADFRCSRRRLK